MKILLTGSSGFIGGHLLSSIREKYGDDSLVLLSSKENKKFSCIKYASLKDFELDKSCFDEITHIIHAGAFIPKSSMQLNDINLNSENIEYTKELLSYRFHRLVKFINLSTVDIYDAGLDKISEKSEIKPVSLYASSKLYCEEMVKHFSTQRGIDYINLRVGHVYGPGEEKYKKILPFAIKNILQDLPLELWGDGSETRSFIFINDVVKSIVNSIEMSINNIDINVVSGTAISIKELLDKLIEISGKHIIINQIESGHKKRNSAFNNNLLLSTLLEKEIGLNEGLRIEYDYMKSKYENCI